MWNLYVIQQETRTRASELYGVPQLGIANWGERDIYAELAFDNAVTWVGRYIEGKLNEMDDKGTPKYRLEDILKPPGVSKYERNRQSLQKLRGAFSF